MAKKTKAGDPQAELGSDEAGPQSGQEGIPTQIAGTSAENHLPPILFFWNKTIRFDGVEYKRGQPVEGLTDSQFLQAMRQRYIRLPQQIIGPQSGQDGIPAPDAGTLHPYQEAFLKAQTETTETEQKVEEHE